MSLLNQSTLIAQPSKTKADQTVYEDSRLARKKYCLNFYQSWCNFLDKYLLFILGIIQNI
jgi:hypothetical protein